MQAGCEARRGTPGSWPWMTGPSDVTTGTYAKEAIVEMALKILLGSVTILVIHV